MRVCVTGGAGFIGANFVAYWLENHPGDKVVVLDKLTYAGSLTRLEHLKSNPNFSFIQGDILDYALGRNVFAEIDTVVHFAAETHVDRSLSGLEAEKLFFRTNLEGTVTLLHAAYDAGVSRFHHVSTDEVFGDLAYETPDRFDEETPYAPNNPYSISKAAADFAVRGFYHTHSFPVTISNCTNNYGPYQTPEKAIPRAIALLLKGEKVKLYTDKDGIPGRNVRDWLHVKDHCSAIEKIILAGKIGETYCVGSNNELSNYRLISTILEIISESIAQPLSMEQNVEQVQDRPGHDRRYAMNAGKLERELNWSPEFSFEKGIRATIAWYLSPQGKAWLEAEQAAINDVRNGQGEKVAGVK